MSLYWVMIAVCVSVVVCIVVFFVVEIYLNWIEVKQNSNQLQAHFSFSVIIFIFMLFETFESIVNKSE